MFKPLKNLMFSSFVVPDEQGGEPPIVEDGKTEEEQEPVDNEAEEINEAELSKGIMKDESRLEVMQDEYNKLADGIHDEFEKVIETNPETLFSDDEMEVLEVTGTLAQRNKLLRDKFESFRDEKLSLKKSEIDAFNQELSSRKNKHSLISAQNSFLKENPGVDMKEFADYLQNDLTPRLKQSLLEKSKNDKSEFLRLAYAEYKKVNGEEQEEDELPADLSSTNGESAGKLTDLNEQGRESYLRSIGV